MESDRKRKYKRIRTLVLFNVNQPDITNRESRAALVDVSLGGVAFETQAEFYVGNNVILRIILPDKKIFVLECIIRRVQRRTGTFLYGSEFVYSGASDRKKLEKIISEISSL